jgi:hypothetical protein
MIRFFYAAVAALLVCMCVELAVAQPVSLSPGIADATSAPRFQSPVSANVNRIAGPSIADQQLLSERCASLNASADWVKNNPYAGRNPRDTPYSINAWGSADAQASPDARNELERQASMLGCPKSNR